jgi:hypothetical protein
MKEQIETAVPRRKFVAGDSDEARKTATGHSCNPLCATLKTKTTMKIFIISLLTVLLSCFSRQNNNENASQQKGKIKFITSFGFDAVEKDNEPPKDTLTSKATFVYDEKGNLIEGNYYDLKTNSVFSKDKRVYDDRGNMVEIIFYNRIGDQDGKYTYKYDSLNNEIQKDTYWKGRFEGKVITTYDYKSMIVTVSYYNGNGSFEHKNHYKIDDKGNHLEDYGWDGELMSRSRYEYDDKGNIIKEYSESWEMDTTNSVIVYEYDIKNNEVMRKITDLNTNSVSRVKTEYTYDNFGNWIKWVKSWSWNDSRQTEKREIEYYVE